MAVDSQRMRARTTMAEHAAGKKVAAGAMDASGEVRNSPFPSPVTYRSRGATPPKTPHATHINAGGTLRR
jgi:hypothetical protein